jgi:hypothetical protein
MFNVNTWAIRFGVPGTKGHGKAMFKWDTMAGRHSGGGRVCVLTAETRFLAASDHHRPDQGGL